MWNIFSFLCALRNWGFFLQVDCCLVKRSSGGIPTVSFLVVDLYCIWFKAVEHHVSVISALWIYYWLVLRASILPDDVLGSFWCYEYSVRTIVVICNSVGVVAYSKAVYGFLFLMYLCILTIFRFLRRVADALAYLLKSGADREPEIMEQVFVRMFLEEYWFFASYCHRGFCFGTQKLIFVVQIFTSWSHIMMYLQKYLVRDVVHVLRYINATSNNL